MKTRVKLGRFALLTLAATVVGCDRTAPVPAAPAGTAAAPNATPGVTPAGITGATETRGGGGANDPVASNAARALNVGFLMPRLVAANIYSSRGMVVEAVYYATAAGGGAQTGQVISTGTITVGGQDALYSPSPTDRLVVKLGEQTHEFVVKQAQGDGQQTTAAGWLLAPHQLQYTHRMPGQAEAEIAVRFDGQNFEVKASGWANLAGQKYDVDLTGTGSTGGTRDLDGQDTKTQYTLTGTVKGNGCEVDVKEQHTLAVVASNSPGLLHSQRGSATQVNATIGNTVRCDGQTYLFDNVQVQTNMKDKGGSSSTEVVAASGAILRNGQAFGVCALQNGIVWAATGGEPIRLDGTAAAAN